jgi:hypothetical protein
MVPRRGALTISTNQSSVGRCAANFQERLWNTGSIKARENTDSRAIFLSTACAQLVRKNCALCVLIENYIAINLLELRKFSVRRDGASTQKFHTQALDFELIDYFELQQDI